MSLISFFSLIRPSSSYTFCHPYPALQISCLSIFYLTLSPLPPNGHSLSPLFHVSPSTSPPSCAVFSSVTFTSSSFPSKLFAIYSPQFLPFSVPPAPAFTLSFSWAEQQHISRNTYASTKHHIPFSLSC